MGGKPLLLRRDPAKHLLEGTERWDICYHDRDGGVTRVEIARVHRSHRRGRSDLNTLTGAWGVEMTTGKIAADLNAATQLNTGAGREERVITWLSLRGDQIDRDEVATSMLEFIIAAEQTSRI